MNLPTAARKTAPTKRGTRKYFCFLWASGHFRGLMNCDDCAHIWLREFVAVSPHVAKSLAEESLSTQVSKKDCTNKLNNPYGHNDLSTAARTCCLGSTSARPGTFQR